MGKKHHRSLEDEFVEKKQKKTPLIERIRDFVQPQTNTIQKKAPVTFNVGLAIILFFFYVSIMITGGPSQPMIFLLAIPTLYILARYISLERKRYDGQQQTRD